MEADGEPRWTGCFFFPFRVCVTDNSECLSASCPDGQNFSCQFSCFHICDPRFKLSDSHVDAEDERWKRSGWNPTR